MAKLSEAEVRKVALLARIELSDAEVEKFARELTDILQFVEMLNELDTDNVEPTAQVTGLLNVSEEDEVQTFVEDKMELLKCSPLDINYVEKLYCILCEKRFG